MARLHVMRRIAGTVAAALLVVSFAAAPAQASWYLLPRPGTTPTTRPPTAVGTPAHRPTASFGQPEVGSLSWYYARKLAILRGRPATAAPAPATNQEGSDTPAPTSPDAPASAPLAPPAPAPGTPAASPSSGSPAAPAGVTLTTAERHLVELVNQARRDHGLPPLAVDPDLVRLARLKAADIQAKGYFAHVSPAYGSPYDMERRAGIAARVMGAENLAESKDVDRAHMQLMASDGHRANILNPDHDTIGVAVAPIPYGVLVVQLFLGDRYR